ncbi:hypothetical protein DFQ28_009801 [Apophysomyces sp. BC1034]|nr:hypothetical protein DFQ28_009801 [Apophysomyces sp. BC1034]
MKNERKSPFFITIVVLMDINYKKFDCVRQMSTARNCSRQYEFGPYKLLQTLGEGEFGKVKLGLHPETGEEVAIKLIKKDSVKPSTSRLNKVEREIAVLKDYHAYRESPGTGGELFEHILAHRHLKEKDARKLFAQLISSVQYMHQKNVVHRDLKLENLLLDRHRNIIVTDFGFANHFSSESDDLMETSCGSPCYAAPELVVNDGLYAGSAVDIWSCGVILYAMLCGYLPFDDDPSNPDGDNINLLYRYILSSKLTFPDFVNDGAKDLLRQMLVPDPAKRCTMSTVIKHPWLQEYWPLFQKNHEELEAEGSAKARSIFDWSPSRQRKRHLSSASPPLARPATTYGTYSFRHLSIGRTAAERFKQTGTVQFNALRQHRAAEKLLGFFTNKTPKAGGDSAVCTDSIFPSSDTPPQFQSGWMSESRDDGSPKIKERSQSNIYGSIRKYIRGSRISSCSETPAPEDENVQETSIGRQPLHPVTDTIAHPPAAQQNQSYSGLEYVDKPEGAATRQFFSSCGRKSVMASVRRSIYGKQTKCNHPNRHSFPVTNNSPVIGPPVERKEKFRSTRKKFLQWFKKKSQGEHTSHTAFTRAMAKTDIGRSDKQPANKPKLPSVTNKSRNSRSRTIDGLSSLAKIVTPDRMEPKIRLHNGAVDRSALTSRQPSQILADVTQILQALGIDIKKDGYYKIKCSRRKAKVTQSPQPRNIVYTRPVSSRHSQVSDILSENLDQLSADSSLASIQVVPTTTHSFLSASFTDLGPAPQKEPIYGSPSVDTGEEVRFVVEICRFRNLPGLYIVDIRRLRGPVWAYKFLYHKLLDLLDLDGKGGYIHSGPSSSHH